MSLEASVDTPNSSPPPADMSKKEKNGVSEAMRVEEEEMARQREEEEAKRNEEMAKERQKDIEGGTQVVDQKFKALEYLLTQSKVRQSVIHPFDAKFMLRC